MLLGRHPSFFYSLSASASGVVDELAGRLNESILLGSIDHGRVRNLKYVPSKQALRVDEPADVTDHSYCTAFGKVLLASMPEQDLENYLRDTKFQQFTPNTICDPTDLRRELEKVRRDDYAQAKDEYYEGVSAIAVPIRDPWNSVIASLGASAPSVRMQKAGQFEENLVALRESASTIERIWSEAMCADPKVAAATKTSSSIKV